MSETGRKDRFQLTSCFKSALLCVNGQKVYRIQNILLSEFPNVLSALFLSHHIFFHAMSRTRDCNNDTMKYSVVALVQNCLVKHHSTQHQKNLPSYFMHSFLTAVKTGDDKVKH